LTRSMEAERDMDRDSRSETTVWEENASLVDRYWEWKRRRALRVPERRQDLAASVERLESLRDARRASAVPFSRPKGGESAAEDRNYARQLVVTGGSGPSLRTGEHGMNLAKSFGAELFVLGVVNKHLAFRAGLYYGKFMAELERRERGRARDIRRIASQSGARHEGLIARGRPWQVIVQAAEEVEADCIVMGPLRASALFETSAVDHALTGGACRKVLGHARRPMLVVR
jgi:nucleotide-binding universal stress UspA family protein